MKRYLLLFVFVCVIAEPVSGLAHSMLQWSGASTSIGDETKPFAFSLGNAYPNPFNPSTVIPFQLREADDISIQVFDMLGRDATSLVNDTYPAGNHTVRFDASGMSSGIYHSIGCTWFTADKPYHASELDSPRKS